MMKDNFSDAYIKKLLIAQFEKWGESDLIIEPWMIEAKRDQLRRQRAVKQLDQKLNEKAE